MKLIIMVVMALVLDIAQEVVLIRLKLGIINKIISLELNFVQMGLVQLHALKVV